MAILPAPGGWRALMVFTLALASALLAGAALAAEGGPKKGPAQKAAVAKEAVKAGGALAAVELEARSAKLPAAGDLAGRITTETVTVEPGTRIAGLLRRHGIALDGDSIAAVLLLNPDVEDLLRLRAGDSLTVPALAPAAADDPAAPALGLLDLNLVPRTKRDLIAATGTLEALAPRFQDLPPEAFAAPADREEVAGALDEMLGYLGELNQLVEEDTQPLSPDLLTQSLAGAKAARRILDPLVSSRRPLPAAERRRLVAISESMNLKAKNFVEVRGSDVPTTRWRDVGVEVSVVRPPGAHGAPGLRVWYAPEELRDEPGAAQPFPGLSPRVSKRLLEADYVFWAAEPGKAKPVTDQVPQHIRRGGNDPLALSLVLLPARGKR